MTYSGQQQKRAGERISFGHIKFGRHIVRKGVEPEKLVAERKKILINY